MIDKCHMVFQHTFNTSLLGNDDINPVRNLLSFFFLPLHFDPSHPSSSLPPSPMPHTCAVCGLGFDNKNMHDTHKRKCVQTVSFTTHNGQAVTVTHHENGTFLCYCSHDKCPKPQGFTTVNALQKHMKMLGTAWIGPQEKWVSGWREMVEKKKREIWVITLHKQSTESQNSTLQINTKQVAQVSWHDLAQDHANHLSCWL